MSTLKLEVPATPEELFAVLADGWMYAGWVVGATHIRDVDAHWPAKGALIHHTIGVWPLTVSDATEVIDVEPNRMIELDARAFPVGRAHVRIELEPARRKGHTRVTMTENVSGGPSRLIPKPLTDPLLTVRNRETLHRLVDIALGRREPTGTARSPRRGAVASAR
jgi:hypothetical protein